MGFDDVATKRGIMGVVVFIVKVLVTSHFPFLFIEGYAVIFDSDETATTNAG